MPDRPTLDALLAEARARAPLTPAEIARQRASWVRGEMGMGDDADEAAYRAALVAGDTETLARLEREAEARVRRLLDPAGMKIRTSYVRPPIPYRQNDWSAVDDNTYDGPGCLIGWGGTEAEAIEDLMRQMEDRE